MALSAVTIRCNVRRGCVPGSASAIATDDSRARAGPPGPPTPARRAGFALRRRGVRGCAAGVSIPDSPRRPAQPGPRAVRGAATPTHARYRPARRWLVVPRPAASQPIAYGTLRRRLRTLGFPLIQARVSALRQLVLQAPAPVVADALGFHHTTTTRQFAHAGATWSRYAPGDPGAATPPETTAGRDAVQQRSVSLWLCAARVGQSAVYTTMGPSGPPATKSTTGSAVNRNAAAKDESVGVTTRQRRELGKALPRPIFSRTCSRR
jgi:hypothetical protein